MPFFHALRRDSRHLIAHRPHVVIATLICLAVVAANLAPAWAGSQSKDSAEWLPAPPAVEVQKPTTEADLEQVSVFGIVWKLVLIAGLIYAGSWGFRVWREREIIAPHSGRGGLIRIRESVALGNGGRLYVVEFGSRSLLVSAIGDQICLLTGNASSEMSIEGTSTIPVQKSSRAAYTPESYSGNGTKLRADNFRRTSTWEQKREALVRALQESEQV